MNKMDPKKLVAGAVKVGLIVVVAAFTALLSYNFWQWTFPPEQWYYAILGFGLTGGAVVGYAIVFKWDEATPLQRTISLGMLIVSIIGEIVTAGYGIKIEQWTRTGIVPTQEDFDFMQMAVQVLLLFHFVAVITSLMGDEVYYMFESKTGKDHNKDGHIGKPPKGNQNLSSNAPVSRQDVPHATQQPQPSQYTLPAFLSASGMNTEQAFGDFLNETEGASMGWKVLRDGESKDGYKLPPNISRRNFNELSDKVHANGRVKDF